MRGSVFLAVAVALGNSASQGDSSPNQSTGIPECDKYEAMVTACLPKMCEEERALVELDLEFHRETLSKVIDLRGRQEGAKVCARSIHDAIATDVYGCYAGEADAPKHSIQIDEVRPTDTSVSLTLTSTGIAAGATARLVIAPSISEPATAVYTLPNETGGFTLDTSSAATTSDRGATAGPPIQLEPQTTYCFAIESMTPTARKVLRQGIFTTLPKR